jgi:hypothetical protein
MKEDTRILVVSAIVLVLSIAGWAGWLWLVWR